MNGRTSLILALTVLSLSCPGNAEAQFWKHWFEKEKPAPRKPPVQEKKRVIEDPPPPPRQEPVRRRRQDFDYPYSERKARYRVDVLAPLYLDELVKDGKPAYKGRVPEKAATGADFCQGIQLAADTLTKLNFQIDVYIHDVADPRETPEALIRDRVLDRSDLIIGALQSNQVPAIAQFAKKREINFISAISPSDAGVADNGYFTILQPTLQKHCEAIMRRARKHTRGERTIVYRRSSVPLDESAYNFLVEDERDVIKISCNKLPEKETLSDLFSASETNVIVMAIMDAAYADQLLRQLNQYFPGYKFEVYGMPSWRGMSGLRKADSYPNTVVYLTASSYFDMTTAQGRYLNEVSTKNYGAKANETVCRGYETLFWYAYLLRRYGTIFNTELSDNGIVPFTRYEIRPQRDVNGEMLYNENEHVYWYRYQDASFMVE